MTLSNLTPETAPSTAVLTTPLVEQAFNWRHCWYPVAFLQDLPEDQPYGFSVYDEPFVLFRSQDEKLACLSDRCPHRAARLSDGQIIDGAIECLYHGWQFGADGQCVHIPQLEASAKLPTNACAPSFVVAQSQGLVWVWLGEAEAADLDSIPTLPDLNKPGFVHSDCVVDLPYDQTYLVENVMDPAHVSISHHGVKGGGDRKNAQPLEMEVIENSVQGIRGRWRGANKPNGTWRDVAWFAPNLVLHTASLGDRGWTFGLALYTLPLGKGRCRIFSRGYRNFMRWGLRLKPRWLDHLNTNKILEQDLPLIVGQQAQIEQLGQSLEQLYLPLKTSDIFVIEYRKWLDKFGSSLPFYEGYSSSVRTQVNEESNHCQTLLDRFSRHTQICSSCSRAYRSTIRLKQTLAATAIGLAAVAIVTDGSITEIVALSASLSAAAIAAVVGKFQTHFINSYTRH